MRILLLAILLTTLLPACGGNNFGDRLFDVNYPPIFITVPPGQPSFRNFVIATPSLSTGFDDAIADNGIDVDEIDLIGGVRARLVSTSGEDFSELERIELRVCPVEEANCFLYDLMFSVSDLAGRRQQVVDLNPGEKNFRNLFLTSDEVRMELVLTPFDVTTRTIEARLEWAVGAIGGL